MLSHIGFQLGLLGLEPEKLLNKFGLIGLFLIVFAESGLLIGFFLPGDSLLFTAGFLMAGSSPIFDTSIWAVIATVIAAAIIGDQVGYQIGSSVGPALFDKPKSRLFNPAHVERAQHYLDKHGPRTIVMARFVPIVRTFAPIVAGVGRMSRRVFSTYNVVGGLVWGGGVTTAGYLLGKRFPVLRNNIELVSLVIVAVSLIPILLEFLRHRKEKAMGTH